MPPPELRRIAVVGPFPPLRGGIAQFDARTVRALRERGMDVSAVSFSRLYPKLLFPGRTQWVPGGRTGGEAAEVLDAIGPRSWRRAARLIADLEADLLLVAYWTPVLAPALTSVARHAGTPVAAIVHNARPHERLPMASALARRFLRACSGVLTLSDAVASDVRDLGFDGPVVVTPHPTYDAPPVRPSAERARADLGLPRDGEVALFFGLVRPYKGLDVLVEALPAVLQRRPRVTLVVAGEWYADAEPVRRRIAELGLTDRVVVHDRYVPDDDVATYFCAADVVVQPYRTATQSGVLQMAAAYGVPGVVTDVGGLADPIRDHDAGIVVPPADPLALAAAVTQALDPDVRHRLREGARRLAASRGWGAFAEAVAALYGRMNA